MNRHLVRIVTSIASASVLTMAGAGLAAAAPVPAPSPSATQNTITDLTGAYGEIHRAAADQDNIALSGAVTNLRTVLNHVRGCGAGAFAAPVAAADAKAAELEGILPLPGMVDPIVLSALLDLVHSLVDELVSTLSTSTDVTGGAWPTDNLPSTVPDVTVPDVTVPDVTVPDVTVPDVTVPDVTAPTAPDVTVPDVSTPQLPDITDATSPDTSDATSLDVTVPDVTAPDVTAPDVTVPDVTVPDVTAPAGGAGSTDGMTGDGTLPMPADLSSPMNGFQLPGGPVDLVSQP
ncbi:hypothetical protein [Actinokineospora enzanensis]|uniref:hypothetical protein n=1 Tax=Actinokineospora enzanensis TaxID=155975 RepID=UPI0003760B1B|nr:hypothetical protein [Actinokineospora enzanensis]